VNLEAWGLVILAENLFNSNAILYHTFDAKRFHNCKPQGFGQITDKSILFDSSLKVRKTSMPFSIYDDCKMKASS